ncbi:Lipoprotein-releasing system ATP-binding protein LolD [subsurface metagenome]
MLIEVRNLSISYGQPETYRHQVVLDNLSFGIEKGESIAITGPSGSGKTTLLNLLGSLDIPDKGEIYFNGSDISKMSRKALGRFRNLSLGFVFQQHHLFPQFNLMENVLIPTLPRRDGRGTRQRAEELLQKVGLWEHCHKYPHELSGGECQRTAVVRSLVNNPEIILADEPTGSLDHENSVQLMDLLMKFNREDGVTLAVVTHSRELALKLDRTYRLLGGSLELIR